MGEKPAFLFPFGWRISRLIGQYFGQREKTLFRTSYSCLTGRVVDFHKGNKDLHVPHVPKWAQNDNRDSILAYRVFSKVPVTGFIGALLIMYFQIIEIRD